MFSSPDQKAIVYLQVEIVIKGTEYPHCHFTLLLQPQASGHCSSSFAFFFSRGAGSLLYTLLFTTFSFDSHLLTTGFVIVSRINMLTFTFIAAALLTTTHAANDWNVPCTSGVCSYDVEGTNDTAPATMSLVCPFDIKKNSLY